MARATTPVKRGGSDMVPPESLPPALAEPLGQAAPDAPPRDIARVCGTCTFWAPFESTPGRYVSQDADGPTGMCRCEPPKAALVFNMIEKIGPFTVSRAVWPMTYIGENCGKWDGQS